MDLRHRRGRGRGVRFLGHPSGRGPGGRGIPGSQLRGPSGSTTPTAPTGEKPQSKLWFNDGIWWGSLFDRVSQEYRIYRYDRASQSWSNTGVLIDERNTSKADTLWDGEHLYVATAPRATASDPNAYVRRYSYDAATPKYTLDQGFPVLVASVTPTTA